MAETYGLRLSDWGNGPKARFCDRGHERLSAIEQCLSSFLPSRTSFTNESLTPTIKYWNVDSTLFLYCIVHKYFVNYFIFTSPYIETILAMRLTYLEFNYE